MQCWQHTHQLRVKQVTRRHEECRDHQCQHNGCDDAHGVTGNLTEIGQWWAIANNNFLCRPRATGFGHLLDFFSKVQHAAERPLQIPQFGAECMRIGRGILGKRCNRADNQVSKRQHSHDDGADESGGCQPLRHAVSGQHANGRPKGDGYKNAEQYRQDKILRKVKKHCKRQQEDTHEQISDLLWVGRGGVVRVFHVSTAYARCGPWPAAQRESAISTRDHPTVHSPTTDCDPSFTMRRTRREQAQ